MAIRKRKKEISRLIESFEIEAKRFHDLKISTFFITQGGASEDREFDPSNHTIMLWQYYGMLKNSDIDNLMENIKNSDMQYGVRGAEITQGAVIEGVKCKLFVRMAIRAAHIFNKKEKDLIKSRIVNEIIDTEKDGEGTPVASTNDNELAIWINYLLYYMSMVNPENKNTSHIAIDPFSLSLFALEQLLDDLEIRVENKSYMKLENIKFKVALSFPGEKRNYVKNVADILTDKLGQDQIFYDNNYKAQLAKPNLDILLQSIYRNQSDLIVIFLCQEYAEKEWCGLEWRAIREIIKKKQDDKILFVRFDKASIDGVFSIDGYLNADTTSEEEMADLIIERVNLI